MVVGKFPFYFSFLVTQFFSPGKNTGTSVLCIFPVGTKILKAMRGYRLLEGKEGLLYLCPDGANCYPSS